MADNKTQENEGSVIDFINALENQRRKDDAIASLALYEEATSLQAKLWGTSIIGYGRYHYIYESGREGDFMKAGFFAQKNQHDLLHHEWVSRLTKFAKKTWQA